MAASDGRSPFGVYLAMAGVATAVFVGLTVLVEPATEPVERDLAPATVTAAPAPSLERDFLTAVLGRPRVSGARRYCDDRGCCPTWRTTFGTTAPERDVIEAFAAQGYASETGRATGRGGPFPPARWIAELDLRGRWEWRRVEVASGPEFGRNAWPTVFVESSIACGAG